jgi:iron uptake system component EfeO
MTLRHPFAFGLGALLVLAVTACGKQSATPSTTTTDSTEQRLAVKLVDAGCSPAKLEARAGSVKFDVTNGGTSKVSEFEIKNTEGIILGERENIVAGIAGSFTLRLDAGNYVLSCPNGDSEDQGSLVVKGTSSAPAHPAAAVALRQATTRYRAYVIRESGLLLAGTRSFVAALRGGRLAEAKELFGPVRSHYEAIEPVAESFGNLDPQIDARVNDVAKKQNWTGFHRIEQILWKQGTTAGTTVYATRLLADVTTLDRRVRTLSFQPAQLANGAVELLDEVAGSKITGEEDRYSHTDLADFQGNLTGARVAFNLLKPALVERGSGTLAQTITVRFDDVQQGLDHYRRPTRLGFALYDSLSAADRRKLAQQIDALAEPLSTVASLVAS